MSDFFWKKRIFRNFVHPSDSYIFSDKTLFKGCSQLIICRNQREISFTIFDNHYEFLSFFKNLGKNDDRCYYEVISGEKPYKFFFDIDISSDNPSRMSINGTRALAKSLVFDLLKSVQKHWKEVTSQNKPFNPDLDIIIYTSHGLTTDKRTKYSFHLVFPRLIVEDCKIAKNVAGIFTSELDDEIKGKGYIDMSVYKTTQQLRILGNYKFENKQRIKKLEPEWNFFDISGRYSLPENLDKEDKCDRMFLDSFITYMSKKKVYLVRDTSEKVEPTYKISDSFPEIPNDILDSIPYGFRRADSIGNITKLKREVPSYCPICEQLHEHENACLVYLHDTGRWIFYCHRANTYAGGKKMFLN